jgi:undecaprenyl-diphosphatase
MMLIAHALRADDPPPIDRRVRRVARSRRVRAMNKFLWPLFPLGLPGGYITIAYATANALRRRRHAGGPAIVASAWLGWLVHRAAKLALKRERPRRRGMRRRTDSYPSGHTTGATAMSLTTAYVLRRCRLISRPSALALASIPPIVMGAYRVIDDEHWATDVVGGWLLGTAIGLGCNAVLADAVGGGARQVTGSAGSPRAPRRRGHREPPTFAKEVGRGGSPGDRAGTARPFDH